MKLMPGWSRDGFPTIPLSTCREMRPWWALMCRCPWMNAMVFITWDIASAYSEVWAGGKQDKIGLVICKVMCYYENNMEIPLIC